MYLELEIRTFFEERTTIEDELLRDVLHFRPVAPL